jgi:hypothetical protein
MRRLAALTPLARCRVIIGGLAAGGLMFGASGVVLGAGIADADTYGYLGDQDGTAYAREMSPEGGDQTPFQARNFAVALCTGRRGGESEQALIIELQTHNYSTRLAVDTVVGAEFHFCPEYATTSNALHRR